MSETGNIGFVPNDIYQAMQERLDLWPFADMDEHESFGFAHSMASIALELYPPMTHVNQQSNIFSGQEVPDSLKPLVSRGMRFGDGPDEVLYHEELVVGFYPRGEHTYIPGHTPVFDEMIKQGLSYDEILEQFREKPELLEDMYSARTIQDNAVVARFSDQMEDFGLEFITSRSQIELAVYGQREATRRMSRYMTTYYDKPRVLTQTVASLAVLGAKHWNKPFRPSVVPLSSSAQSFLGLNS